MAPKRFLDESSSSNPNQKRTCRSPVSASHSQQLSLLPPPSRPARIYDVFLSFRGEDTRNTFVGHLYKALNRYRIYTFKDQKLKKGKTVEPELLKSIEQSRYSIVILSKNYATSTWCLDELVKIIHCMDQFGQIVQPIFYNIDPSDVRKQTGSFKRAFDNHEKAFQKEKVLQWREALTRVSSISGSDSRDRDESVLIEEIVRDVSDKLFSEFSNDDNNLVGMSDHMEQMNSSLLCNDGSEEVLMVVYGMGGIGNTNISRALYNRKRIRKSPVSVSHSQQLSLPPPPSRPARTYDVFLSFRGKDTRNIFVGNLYKALDRLGIYTFKDDQNLKKGKTISAELLKSIKESRFSIVTLSKNYATSPWCLDELVKIIDCMDQFGQIVVPIFYNVDPSDVRNQTGSFKTAFDRHEKRKEKEKVLQWRETLSKVGSMSGSVSRNRDVSELIEEVVRVVSDKLFSESSNDDNKLVGMNHHMEQMNSLLCNDRPNEVLMIGIWGMGGIGKTTISKALYNRYSRLYAGRCSVANVKDNFQKHGPSSLREKLLSEILMDRNLKIHTLNDNFNVIKERLSRKKVFIVLDDVDDVEQLETLADKHDWFGPGSRIIITTRDQHLLISHGVNYLYNVMSLRDGEALQLFSQYAFKQDKPTPDYLELSNQFVLYAKGLPLALKNLGFFLHRKSFSEWLSELSKLQKNPNARIQDVLIKKF